MCIYVYTYTFIHLGGVRRTGIQSYQGTSHIHVYIHGSFPGGSDDKESACQAGDLALIPGSGRYPREGNGYPLQYFCLENSMNWGAQWATVYEVAKSQTQLSD